MDTIQKPLYRKITLTFPEHIVQDLHTIPKGERSAYTASLIEKDRKLKKFREMLDELRKGPPVKIKLYRGGWRKRVSLSKSR